MKPITLITGAAKGLGFETARLLGRQGHHVVIGARDLVRGEAAAEVLRQEGLSAGFVSLDIKDQLSIQSAEQTIAQEFGRLDHLINNAAVLLDHYQGLRATTADQLTATLNTNVVGTHSVTLAFAPLLRRGKAARVVNVSSGAGQLSDMFGNVWAPAYQISKTALNALTCLWAAEFKEDSIPVNAVCPGWCQTDMGGEGATRTAADGAAGIAWLAIEAARELTGKFFRDRTEIPW